MFDLAAIFFGVFVGVFPLTLVKVIRQTRKIVSQSRTHHNAYLYMIWIEAVVNFVFAIVTYLYLIEVFPGSLAFYLGTVTLWAIQTQLLSQIIANRVALIMVNKRKAKWLKLGLVAAIACVNIAVYVIWPTAYRADATPAQKHLNDIFERTEKAFFLVVDLGLNLTFLYLVRFRLIAHGLSKYWQLFRFNVAIALLSTAMDAALLGMLSLPNPYLYVQFAPVVYIVKLHIELTMASLIAKIVKKTVNRNRSVYHAHSSRSFGRTYAKYDGAAGGNGSPSTVGGRRFSFGNDVEIQKTSNESDIALTRFPMENGIIKTVTTTVVSEGTEGFRPRTQPPPQRLEQEHS